jgi:VanZ family protein
VKIVEEKITPVVTSWGPALIVMAIIFLLSNTPGSKLPNLGVWDTLFKKGAHMTGYALLAMSCARGIGKADKKAIITAWLLAIMYAATDEFHQSFIPGRHPSPLDVGIDGVGAFIGLLLLAKSNLIQQIVIRKPAKGVI